MPKTVKNKPTAKPSKVTDLSVEGSIEIRRGSETLERVPVQFKMPKALDPEEAADSIESIDAMVEHSVAAPLRRLLRRHLRQSVPDHGHLDQRQGRHPKGGGGGQDVGGDFGAVAEENITMEEIKSQAAANDQATEQDKDNSEHLDS